MTIQSFNRCFVGFIQQNAVRLAKVLSVFSCFESSQKTGADRGADKKADIFKMQKPIDIGVVARADKGGGQTSGQSCSSGQADNGYIKTVVCPDKPFLTLFNII